VPNVPEFVPQPERAKRVNGPYATSDTFGHAQPQRIDAGVGPPFASPTPLEWRLSHAWNSRSDSTKLRTISTMILLNAVPWYGLSNLSVLRLPDHLASLNKEPTVPVVSGVPAGSHKWHSEAWRAVAALLDSPDRKVRPVEVGPLTGRVAMVNSGSPACCDNPDKCCREPYAQASGSS
jgi:hypothetical protein